MQRHATDVRTVHITMTAQENSVQIRVRDDGHGGERTAPSGGLGLLGLRERLDRLGGTLSAGPTPDGGWDVTATMPDVWTADTWTADMWTAT